ncbi:MAG: aerobic-type carbon monoxide dehydrogenase, large subunit CoxL/CutL-like protein [Firmicutes bacterium]|nr:aerobic-type carbon monoxide dehydrogenase, large subunit CoxL/CutL-like protein [Bacillota bacterium]
MKKRGTGIGCMWYGIGNTGLPNPASAFVEWLDDGSVNLLVGCADIGQGSDTVLAQIVAEELGVSFDQINVTSADTMITPDGGATSASRQTYISGNAARLAAAEAKKVAMEEAAEKLMTPADQLVFADGYVYNNGSKTDLALKDVITSCRNKGKLTLGHGWFNPDTTGLDPETGHGSPFGTYAFATQIVEVEVDTGTGKIEVLKVVAAHDVGRAVNPEMVIGQIEGGSVMGLGYATLEELEVNQGKIKNPNFDAYLIATTLDVPEIESVIVEDPEPTGPFGAKGVGEPALIPTAAAIANAVYDAIGVRIYSLPITPEKVLAALEEQNGK